VPLITENSCKDGVLNTKDPKNVVILAVPTEDIQQARILVAIFWHIERGTYLINRPILNTF